MTGSDITDTSAQPSTDRAQAACFCTISCTALHTYLNHVQTMEIYLYQANSTPPNLLWLSQAALAQAGTLQVLFNASSIRMSQQVCSPHTAVLPFTGSSGSSRARPLTPGRLQRRRSSTNTWPMRCRAIGPSGAGPVTAAWSPSAEPQWTARSAESEWKPGSETSYITQ